MTWTTIPRWLYENDLPDERLQEVYVQAAHRKLAELLEERRAAPSRALDEQIAQARVFFAQAVEALTRYKRRLRDGP